MILLTRGLPGIENSPCRVPGNSLVFHSNFWLTRAGPLAGALEDTAR
jgi:hypothetical protein